jgi:hypothetical protein
LFAKSPERAIPGIDVQFIGIHEGTVDVEDETEHSRNVHVFELIVSRQ